MSTSRPAPVVVVMGVAGSGKSTVGTLLAERLHVPFVEGDEFHTPAAIARMATGHPLTEQERVPWLRRINRELVRLAPGGVVGACSALTSEARRLLAEDIDHVRFVWLRGNPDVLEARLAHRTGNPITAALLPSQLGTLEPPRSAFEADITQSPEVIVQHVLDWLTADRSA